MAIRTLVLIPYITEYDHYQTCSPKEAGMGWLRSLMRLGIPVRKKVSTTRLHAGFRAFLDLEKLPATNERLILPYGLNDSRQHLLLRVTKVDWPRSLTGPYLLYCEFDMGLSDADRDFFAGRTYNEGGIFTQNILNETDRIIGRTFMHVAQMSKFHDLVSKWNFEKVDGLEFWSKKKEIKAAA